MKRQVLVSTPEIAAIFRLIRIKAKRRCFFQSQSKILESKERIEETITIPKRPKEDEKEGDEDKKEEKKDKENGTEEQGSNA